MAAPTIRSSHAPTAGLAQTSGAGTAVGDLVIVVTWERGGAGAPTHTLDSAGGYVEILSHEHNDGSTDGRLSVAYKLVTSAGAVSYQAYTTDGSGTVQTGLVVLQSGTYTTVGIASNSNTQTNNALPNPPSVTGLTGDYLVLAIAGWYLGSAATVTSSAPTNYAEAWQTAGSTDVELALATRSLTGLSDSTEDPGTFGDNVAPNGSATMTIAIRGPATETTSVDTTGTGSIVVDATVVPGSTEHTTAADVGGAGSINTTAITRIHLTSLDVDVGGLVDIDAFKTHDTSLSASGAGTLVTVATQGHQIAVSTQDAGNAVIIALQGHQTTNNINVAGIVTTAITQGYYTTISAAGQCATETILVSLTSTEVTASTASDITVDAGVTRALAAQLSGQSITDIVTVSHQHTTGISADGLSSIDVDADRDTNTSTQVSAPAAADVSGTTHTHVAVVEVTTGAIAQAVPWQSQSTSVTLAAEGQAETDAAVAGPGATLHTTTINIVTGSSVNLAVTQTAHTGVDVVSVSVTEARLSQTFYTNVETIVASEIETRLVQTVYTSAVVALDGAIEHIMTYVPAEGDAHSTQVILDAVAGISIYCRLFTTRNPQVSEIANNRSVEIRDSTRSVSVDGDVTRRDVI